MTHGATAETRAQTLLGDRKQRVCCVCSKSLNCRAFSRHQLAKANAKCKTCVATDKQQLETKTRLKRCVQCFQSLPKTSFSKRQAHLLDAKCVDCVQELERAAIASPAHVASKWNFDRFYRVCHRGKNGGVSVRSKHNIASPVLGYIPLGRVFRATAPICNEQGDPMVRLEGPLLSEVVVRDESKVTSREEDGIERQFKEAWIPCRSIRNEIMLENHQGPFTSDDEYSSANRFFRCVVEGCKVRAQADLTLSELGYVLYGDVVEVVESTVAPDGVVFLRLHGRYFDGAAWVVERSLDNESVLNEVEGPWSSLSTSEHQEEKYRCVQDSGAPVRTEPELTAPPVGRIPCGALVAVSERKITDQRQVFLRIASTDDSVEDEGKWVIETSTCCASVMIRVSPLHIST